MVDYFFSRCQQFYGYLEATIFLTPAWYLFAHQTELFFTSKAVTLIAILWFVDLLTKNAAYLMDKNKKVVIEKALSSYRMIGVWLLWMGVAYLFRYFGASLVAYPMELGAILIQGGSLFKHVCMCSDREPIRRIGENFEIKMEEKVNDTFKPVASGIDALSHINSGQLAHYPHAGYCQAKGEEFIHCPEHCRPYDCPFRRQVVETDEVTEDG